jgi:Ras-related protein Rab-28
VQSDSDEEPENLQYKVVVLGNGTVGKTSLIMRFCEDYFAKSYKQTIGVDFFIKRLEMPENTFVTLQVWDIGGQSIFGKMISTYIYEANAIILCYDITNHQSFVDLDDWLDVINKTFEGRELPLLALMGNKIDLNHMQAVKTDQHDQVSKIYSSSRIPITYTRSMSLRRQVIKLTLAFTR